jgi:hypothetical protein
MKTDKVRGAAGVLLYHREPGPVSIDVLRRFLAQGWRLVAWPDGGSRLFVLDFINGGIR